MADAKPYLWVFDSERKPLADCLDLFADWADIVYIGPGQVVPDWDEAPDAVFFSAEIAGGVQGSLFADLCGEAGNTPLLAVAKLRSLSQAVSFFRAGAMDYLSLPLDEEELRDRLDAVLEKAARQAMQGMVVQLEPVDTDAGEVGLSLLATSVADDEDILAHLPKDALANVGPDGQKRIDIISFAPVVADDTPDLNADIQPPPTKSAEPPSDESPTPTEHDMEMEAESAPAADVPEDEPEAVDGLPIPTLWEELPCGLLVFDSAGNLVFSNSLGLDQFGYSSLAELEDALEYRRSEFNAYGANHKPLADNQWPQVLALKARAARSAVVSNEKRDKRRLWLRIDCLPHLAEGKINRLTVTIVNLTGELPPLILVPAPDPSAPLSAAKRPKAKARGKRHK